MQDNKVNSIGALTRGERPDGGHAALQIGAIRNLGHVAPILSLIRVALTGLVVVFLVSIILLRGSG